MPKPKTPIEDRLWSKVSELPNGCWLWTGYTGGNGYGYLKFGAERSELVHRIAYELVVGLIPPGLDLDHLCRNRACVNPAHLEPVTRRENLRRGERATVVRTGRCQRGHAMSGSNLYIAPEGKRYCRECRRKYVRRWRQQRSVEATHGSE